MLECMAVICLLIVQPFGGQMEQGRIVVIPLRSDQKEFCLKRVSSLRDGELGKGYAAYCMLGTGE